MLPNPPCVIFVSGTITFTCSLTYRATEDKREAIFSNADVVKGKS